jgi:hypothetical protein
MFLLDTVLREGQQEWCKVKIKTEDFTRRSQVLVALGDSGMKGKTLLFFCSIFFGWGGVGIGSCSVAQAGLKLTILLPKAPEG